jgi:hypothetical protein
MYDADDLDADLSALIDAGLVAVTGVYPGLRYCLTPEGQRALRAAEEHEAALRTSARELAERRHAAAQEGKVIRLFSDQGA